MRLRLLALLIVAAAVVISGVFFLVNDKSAVYAQSDGKAYSVDRELVNSNTEFALNIFKRLVEEDKDQNIFISPFSISTALAMTYNGAEGTTKEAMSRTLSLEEFDMERLNLEYDALIESLENADSQVQLSIANSIWIKKEFEPAVKADFMRNTKDFYGSEVFARDFGDSKTVGEINGWIGEETKGKITRMLDSISPDMAMFLVNAIYFKGDWAAKFDKANTKGDDFFLTDGSAARVDMMYNKEKYGYYDGEGFKAARLPYGRDKLAMYVFLPDEGVDPDSFIGDLDAEEMDEYISGIRVTDDVMLKLPKFKIEYGKKRLNQALAGLGMGIAFTEGANFNGIAPQDLAIAFVDHKAFVIVNEEGTEAAAATVVGIRTISIPRITEFIVNRPFFFIIRDDRSGSILFMGKVVNPPGV